MKMSILILIGYRNLRANRLRSFLTIGGVAIGIGIVTLLVCLGFGVQKLVVNEVTKNNSKNVVDISNRTLENFIILNEENNNKLKNINSVEKIIELFESGGKVYWSESQTDTIIYGTTKDFFETTIIQFSEGSYNEFDNENGTAIFSFILARLLGFSNISELLGKEIEFSVMLSEKESVEQQKKIKSKIIGIINDEQNAYAYIPFGYLKKNFQIEGAQSGKIVIKNEQIEEISFIRAQIEQSGFVTESVTDLIKDINSFFAIISIIMVVLGTIIMSISAMGMLNTLSVSLLQRTKEVGILKALGAKRKDIFKMFVFEAAIISFLGGTIGFLGGYLFAYFINMIFNILAVKNNHSTLDFVYIPYL